MATIFFKIVVGFILLNFSQLCCLSQTLDKWQYAEMAIKRMSPVAFTQLPKVIVKSLLPIRRTFWFITNLTVVPSRLQLIILGFIMFM